MMSGMQTPFLREQVDLSHTELAEFDQLTSAFEYVEEHVLNPALLFYVTRSPAHAADAAGGVYPARCETTSDNPTGSGVCAGRFGSPGSQRRAARSRQPAASSGRPGDAAAAA